MGLKSFKCTEDRSHCRHIPVSAVFRRQAPTLLKQRQPRRSHTAPRWLAGGKEGAARCTRMDVYMGRWAEGSQSVTNGASASSVAVGAQHHPSAPSDPSAVSSHPVTFAPRTRVEARTPQGQSRIPISPPPQRVRALALALRPNELGPNHVAFLVSAHFLL